MKKNITRAIAMTLAGGMMLTGCGGAKTGSANTPAGSEAATGAPVETVAASERKDGEQTGYDLIKQLPKLSEEKVTFKMVCTLNTEQHDFGTLNFFKALEEATNVHIEWQCYPLNSYNDQKNVMLASGDIPDAFFGGDAITMTDLIQYGPMGMFIPLDDLMAQNSPNYQARLNEYPTLNGLSTAFDGKKYSYGTINMHPNRDYPDNLYINKAWLDKLGLEIPTNLDEYYDVLKEFKEKDPNGNGMADEIPYTFSATHHIQGYGSLFGAFGRIEAFNGPTPTVYDHFVVENDNAVYNPVTEEYKNAIKGLRRFFEAGLFDQEGFVQEPTQFNAKVASATPVIGSMYNWDLLQMPSDVQAEYVAIKPLKASADAPDAVVKKRQNHISVQPTGFAITNKCKNPEILTKWIDLFYTDEMSILSYYGLDRLVIDKDGIFHYDETEQEGSTFMAWVQQNSPYDGAPKILTFDLQEERVPLEVNKSKKIDVIAEFYAHAPQSVTLPTMNFTTEENDFISSYGMDIQNYVIECQSKWLLGQNDIDAEWDSYLKKLETLKLDEFVALVQTVYDRTSVK